MMRTTSSRVGRNGVAFLSLTILLVILTLALTACNAGRSGLGSRGTTTSQQSNTQAPSTSTSNNAQQQIQSTDQQIQSSMQTLDGAASDAQNADNSDDNGPLP